METNENNETDGGSASPESKPKKRTGLFGARRSSASAAASEPVASPALAAESAPAENAAPEKKAAAKSAPKKASAKKATPKEAPAKEAPAKAASKKTTASKSSASKSPKPDAAIEESGKVAPSAPSVAILFQAPDLPPAPPKSQQQSSASGDEPTSSRRRTRRRAGEEGASDSGQPNNVVKVRQPRQTVQITEPQKLKGSTRLEAKKQRRRDGRDAGRRRPVITEAEFLARRESVDRVMVVRQKHDRIQIGVLEDGVLVEHYVAQSQESSLIGNVYLGRVQNVLPSMEAAFVDIGRGRNAVLYSGEVDWDAVGEASGGNQPRRIELALKPGDKVLVQVTKDPVGHKGARLTSQVSLPGRYLVYVPNGSMNGISRKLPDTERARLKAILKDVLPENVGVIVRTAAEGASEEQLTLDVNRLIAQWSQISAATEKGNAPSLLHSEPDLLIKIIRDVFNEDFQKLVVEGKGAHETISGYLSQVAPDLLDRLES
ncbi:MAG TPA: ribonuclease E/G, partial [Terrimesophilobacter sp.]|nr:ribonuclease E/G [Terrimesophilobacter sp.]